ncbi:MULTISPECIES: ATP-binding cassette domain-containing protein [unclassified Dehalobacter]|uniref:energy-coupling factor ABC transporter ATP-binding protein n=1 Tax=unclassified Dehalobacter TaxID=2635733 RepID=UPI000E6C5128|nr:MULTISPECIES: ATP-binding cassette domain-containing protein [unclassified Dehalobacter]RJE47453.1 energy-coupling factor ABC transporter ATP-binding protein [Dehalobacter sp. MCB1]TCX48735.1 energy-coupling factor ABC transporter ATP-binding protein [Dehalobacter sp. 14DCB1]TCX56217.1 energy-coupling factor ABC transporter ATP-binding protein [Dehalobacter sp. 12DCB1]
MIVINDLTFKYKGSHRSALKNINLRINKGDFVGIIGSSGAGKSTLTYTLNGIVPHHFTGDFYGSVIVDDVDTVEVHPEQLSSFIGSVFQDIDGQMVASVVEDELLFGLENFGIPREEIETRVNEALDTIGIAGLRYRSIHTLSGGQKQKVAIAAIVALRPSVLLLDEPTGELDPQSSMQIFQMLRTLNKDYGMTIIVVEQKIMLLCEYVNRLVVMHDGEILHQGPVRQVLQNSTDLEQIGVNVPRIVTLANLLINKGLYHGELPLNLDEAEKMVNEVLKYDHI